MMLWGSKVALHHFEASSDCNSSHDDHVRSNVALKSLFVPHKRENLDTNQLL